MVQTSNAWSRLLASHNILLRRKHLNAEDDICTRTQHFTKLTIEVFKESMSFVFICEVVRMSDASLYRL